MKTLLSMLVALIMVLTMSHPAFVSENNHTDPGIAVVAKETEPAEVVIDLELPPVEDPPICEPAPIAEAETEPQETIARESDAVENHVEVYAPESACEPPIQETEPEEGTIDREGEGVACPPPCEPAPIADEEPEIPEETIALEPDPIVGPPIEEP